MDKFVHSPIDLSKTAIRVARLCKGYYTDPVICELFEAYLDPDEIVPYAALSYVWGDESEKQQIYINEKRALVTSNLFKALKSLRQMDKDKVLWVDAICIDQANNKEKGHQVGQMRLVYERAEEVIIWLGESDAKIDILFECAWKLEKTARKLRERTTTYENWETIWDKNEKERLGFDTGFGIHYGEQRRSALRDLLGRTWFKRVWVIQEAASAKRATVRCGPNAVSARIFAILPQLMEEKVDAHVEAVLEVMPGPLRSTSSWWNANRDLETLLRKFGSSESSNPRDAIYALLGISSNFKSNHVLSPDYDATIEETVQDTIWALLFGEVLDRSLYKLPMWGKRKFLRAVKDLPGSVFDWALSARETPVLVRLLTRGNAPEWVQGPSSNEGFLHHKFPLHALVQNDGPLSVIQILMSQASLDINYLSKSYDGNAPLHLAAERGLESVVKLLLQHPSIDVNLRGHGLTVRNFLRASNFYNKLFISNENEDEYGPETPLNIAVAKGHPAVIKGLLQYRSNGGVGVRAKHSGGTALHLAAAVLKHHPKSAEVVQELLHHEVVDVNGKGWYFNPPLYIAVILKNDCMIRALLQQETVDVDRVVRFIDERYARLRSRAEVESMHIIATLTQDDGADHRNALKLVKRAVWLGKYAVVKELLVGRFDRDRGLLGQALIRASAAVDQKTIEMLLG